MSREFPLSDRYGDETQNPALQAREYERSDALLPEERALFRPRRAGAPPRRGPEPPLRRKRLCRGGRRGELTKPRLTNPPKAATI